ncbi:ATP-binding protein [Bradyrhizobium sp. HKCCYLS1011]|uniref:ATP-binding protein n=1 Tax=Bradyrhizobium sp. HKCCYLS1011 TaxID=3420733 RepID=UPI003EC0D51C
MIGPHELKEDAGIEFGPFSLYPARRLLLKEGVPLRIGDRALDILVALVARSGEVVGKEDLIAKVWPGLAVDESSLRVHIKGLRKTLGDGQNEARYVANVAGRGYCFVALIKPIEARPESAPERQLEAARLPAAVKRMVGRDAVVKTLADQLLATRFVSVVGPGGAGKTTVALAVAHALSRTFADAAVFVDLSVLREPQLVPASVASALGLRIHEPDVTNALLAHLAEKRLVLLFDNCEHVISTVAALAEQIASQSTEVHILATSREALRVEGEHVHRLLPLDVPDGKRRLTAEQAKTFSAIALFVNRAVAAGAELELSDDNAEMIAGICRRLDGNALATELAASQVAIHGLRGLTRLLDDRFRLAWPGRRTASQRHQTLNALIEWSYDLLSDEERRCFWRLSAFVGSFDLAAAHAVVAEPGDAEATTLRLIESLGAKSLLTMSTEWSSPRYRLLETTRAFALERMVQEGEDATIQRRHAVYIEALLNPGNGREGDATLCCGREVAIENLGNIRTALGWAFSDTGDPAIAVPMAAAAAPVFIELSLLADCHHWCARALDVLGSSVRDSRLELKLREALAIAGMFTRGNGADVQHAVRRGLELAEAAGDPMSQLRLLAGRHILLTRIANFRGALKIAERYEEIAKSLGDESGLATADWTLGVAHHLLGNQAKARVYFECGFVRAEANPDINTKLFGYDHRIRAMVGLARTFWLRGRPEHAVEIAEKAIEEAKLLGNPVNECISLIYTAQVFLWRGDWTEASHRVEQLIAKAEQHHLRPYHAVGLGFRGELALRHNPALGVALLRKTRSALQAENHHVQDASFRRALAEGLLQLDRVDEAREAIEEAIRQAELSGGGIDLPEFLRIKARILLADGTFSVDQVESILTAALDLSRSQSSLGWELRVAMDLFLLSRSSSAQARQLLAQTLQRFDEGFDTADLRAARHCLEGVPFIGTRRA